MSKKLRETYSLRGILPKIECNFKRFNEGIKRSNYFWDMARPLTHAEEHSRFEEDCLGVHVLIFNVKFYFNPCQLSAEKRHSCRIPP